MPALDGPAPGGRGADIEAARLLGFDGIGGPPVPSTSSAASSALLPPGGGGGSAGAPAATPSSSSATPHAAASESWAAGALHLTAAVVGVGILSLPHCMAALGPGRGAVALVTAGGVSLYTALLLARLGAAPGLGRPPTYADLADRVLRSGGGGGGGGGGLARAAVMALQGEARGERRREGSGGEREKKNQSLSPHQSLPL